MLGPGDKVDPEGNTACALLILVVDEVGIGDNLRLVYGLKVKAVEALLHDRLELHEVVIERERERERKRERSLLTIK